MMKLLKAVGDKLAYWEVWEDGNTLIVHYGYVGDTGETEQVTLKKNEQAEAVMEALASEKLKEGYGYLDEEELTELVVQYSYEENEMEETLEKRHFVEDLMNECLGWTGNGFCDGGDIGSGTANIFNYVVDIEKATETIIKELSNQQLLANVKLAYLTEEEEYLPLYPEGCDFDLIVFVQKGRFLSF
ncbi:WGR domain-containing protein [Evansella caseinilytica]|uniref:WGR domain-containing protein n=1 Tax=Evansella caseinilytica TaxID=1503961 RepID=A0A1H3SQB7_9BACI|nr:WGR domain-containing protein [Evansella caseinilytica]SDZ39309.1 WGR domain-containing protein [Evansella caseinilytica]